METKLAEFIKRKTRYIRGKSLDDSVSIIMGQILFLGGDTTCELISHFGEELESKVRELLERSDEENHVASE